MISSTLPSTIAFAILSLSICAAGAEGPPHPQDTTAPSGSSASATEDFIIQEINVQDVGLDDFVAYLQDVVPGFKAAVMREAGDTGALPLIRLKLKKVSLGQILKLLRMSNSNLQIEQIDGAGGVIYFMHLQPDPNSPPNDKKQSRVDANLRVYPLSTLVSSLAVRNAGGGSKDQAAAGKQAMDDVLSLIKAALGQVTEGGNAPPVLQVHEATQTLIFKGTPPEREALEAAFAALEGRNPV